MFGQHTYVPSLMLASQTGRFFHIQTNQLDYRGRLGTGNVPLPLLRLWQEVINGGGLGVMMQDRVSLKDLGEGGYVSSLVCFN